MAMVSEGELMAKGHEDGNTRRKTPLGMQNVNLSMPGLYGGCRRDKARAYAVHLYMYICQTDYPPVCSENSSDDRIPFTKVPVCNGDF